MQLENIQKNFQNMIFKGFLEKDNLLRQQITYKERLDAHIDAYPALLESYLTNMYPRLASLLANDLNIVIEQFSRHFQPNNFELGNIIDYFSDFFVAHDNVKPYPALIDICLFERLEYKVYHSSPAEMKDLQSEIGKLASSPEKSKISIQDHCRIFKSEFNLSEIFCKINSKSIKNLDELAKLKQKKTFLLYQHNWEVDYLILSKNEAIVLDMILEHKFSKACKELENLLDTGFDFSELIIKLFNLGIIHIH